MTPRITTISTMPLKITTFRIRTPNIFCLYVACHYAECSYYDTQNYYAQNNDTQKKAKNNNTESMTFRITALKEQHSASCIIMPCGVYTECHFPECRVPECRGAVLMHY